MKLLLVKQTEPAIIQAKPQPAAGARGQSRDDHGLRVWFCSGVGGPEIHAVEVNQAL